MTIGTNCSSKGTARKRSTHRTHSVGIKETRLMKMPKYASPFLCSKRISKECTYPGLDGSVADLISMPLTIKEKTVAKKVLKARVKHTVPKKIDNNKRKLYKAKSSKVSYLSMANVKSRNTGVTVSNQKKTIPVMSKICRSHTRTRKIKQRIISRWALNFSRSCHQEERRDEYKSSTSESNFSEVSALRFSSCDQEKRRDKCESSTSESNFSEVRICKTATIFPVLEPPEYRKNKHKNLRSSWPSKLFEEFESKTVKSKNSSFSMFGNPIAQTMKPSNSQPSPSPSYIQKWGNTLVKQARADTLLLDAKGKTPYHNTPSIYEDFLKQPPSIRTRSFGNQIKNTPIKKVTRDYVLPQEVQTRKRCSLWREIRKEDFADPTEDNPPTVNKNTKRTDSWYTIDQTSFQKGSGDKQKSKLKNVSTTCKAKPTDCEDSCNTYSSTSVPETENEVSSISSDSLAALKLKRFGNTAFKTFLKKSKLGNSIYGDINGKICRKIPQLAPSDSSNNVRKVQNVGFCSVRETPKDSNPEKHGRESKEVKSTENTAILKTPVKRMGIGLRNKKHRNKFLIKSCLESDEKTMQLEQYPKEIGDGCHHVECQKRISFETDCTTDDAKEVDQAESFLEIEHWSSRADNNNESTSKAEAATEPNMDAPLRRKLSRFVSTDTSCSKMSLKSTKDGSQVSKVDHTISNQSSSTTLIKVCSFHSRNIKRGKLTKELVSIGDNLGYTVEQHKFFCMLKKRGPQEAKYGLLLPPNRSPLKLLQVFLQSDSSSEAISRAADKLGFDVTSCNSYDSALEEFLSKLHDLVIIDTRITTKSLDYDTLCRSIRNTKGSQHTVVVAIVKKNAFDKDDVTVLSLLDAGYNRCIVETNNVVHYVNELIQLKHSDIRPMAQAATNQALYAALDKCKDIVLITDDSYRLQYANRSIERTLGYRYDETLGKTLQEQLIYDPVQMNTMSSSLMRAREWHGQIALKRKAHEPASSICKAVPITCAGRIPTHFVMVMDTSGASELIAVTPDKPRGSVHSIRRGSTDVRSVGSDYLRRTSLAKLSALPLEAPITKIITLLTQVQEQSTPQITTTIDKVIDILRSTELYSPHVKDDLRLRVDEPVTSDLISALLTQQPQQMNISVSSRRSSNDSSSVARSSTRPVSKVKVPAQIKDLLDSSLTWEFDIFRLEEITNKRPLIHLGMNLFLHFDVPNTLNCDEKTLYNWLTVIEMNYHSDNAYHNSTHAADVMQATAGFLEKDRLKSIMEPLDEATSLLAACAHDIDHPGRSSAFLSNCDNPLAVLYNDVTILENHHAALTFKLTLGDDRVNIFKNLDRETYKVARHNVVDMILATEMTKHFEHLAKFVNVFCTKPSRTDLETEDFIPITLPENITLIKRMMIKCADVSNPTRPLRLCVEWARRIAEEYFSQTDEEKSRGLPVVMPMFDRTTCSIPKSQIGFVDYIVHDMFEAWDAFIDMPELVTYMRQNYIRWKEFDEQGHTTSADIRKLQNTVLMVPMFPSKNPPKKSD